MYGIPATSSGAMKACPCRLYEPTTATAFSLTARRAQFAAPTEVSPSLHVTTSSL